MAERFIPGKKYIFSRDKWLTDTGHVMLYQNNRMIKNWVDEGDGREVVVTLGEFGIIGGLAVSPKHCDIIESHRRKSFREAVDHLLKMDKHAMIQEEINMLCSEKQRLTRRIEAIERLIAKKEQELYEAEKGLMP